MITGAVIPGNDELPYVRSIPGIVRSRPLGMPNAE